MLKGKFKKEWGYIIWPLLLAGCTVKAVGDPNRPITINAHITLDIKGLKDTANNIEDYVSSGETKSDTKPTGGNKP